MAEVATFALFAYRHEAFVAEAIRAVGRQTYRPLQLIVTDDASPDRTREAIEAALLDLPADISVVRLFHGKNLGIPGVINAAVRVAAGRVIVFGAGDDVSAPERVERTMQAFRDPAVAFVHTAVSTIDARGALTTTQTPLSVDSGFGLKELLDGSGEPIVGASCAYAARIFAAFAPLPAGVLREDVILPIRSLAMGKGVFLSARLVRYRMHGGNLHSPSHDQSSAEMAARNLRFAEDRAQTGLQLEEDCARLASSGCAVPEELREFVRRERAYSSLEQRLLATRWRVLRFVRIAAAWASRRVGSAAAAKMLALFVVPGLYAPLLDLRVRLKRRKREMRHG